MNKKIFSPIGFNGALFLITLCLNLLIDSNPPVWMGYGDPPDYLHQSELSLLDKEFYFPHKIPGFYPRPFTIPLFYKLAGSDPETIMVLQKIIHSISVFFLVSALLLFIQNKYIKYALILGMYMLMGWWNIVGWTILILSESISISLLFCWQASWLVLLKHKNNFSFVIHVIITFVFCFTRDTWPYILISFYLLLALAFFLRKNTLFTKTTVLLCFSVVLFFIQQASVQIGQRVRLPLINTIAIRIIQNDQYTEWFVKEGMPCSDQLKQDFKNIHVEYDSDRLKVYTLYDNSSYQALFDWILIKGQNTYMKFLITHPSYTFFLEETPEQLNRIFAYNLLYLSHERGYSKTLSSFFPIPIFNPITVVALCCLLIWLFYKYNEIVFLMPVIITLVFFFNIILSYNADALEVERHLFITTIMIQFVSMISIAFIADHKY